MTEEKIQPEETLEETAAPEAANQSGKQSAPPAPETAEPAGAPPPAAEAAVPAAEEEPAEEEKKKKKIRHLSLEEVEKKLARARIKMGGEASVYIRHLKDRKRELAGEGGSEQ